MKDDVRPRKSVEVPCSGKGWPCCEGGWAFWVDALDSRLPNGPFICSSCSTHKGPSLPVHELWRTKPDGQRECVSRSLDESALLDGKADAEDRDRRQLSRDKASVLPTYQVI